MYVYMCMYMCISIYIYIFFNQREGAMMESLGKP